MKTSFFYALAFGGLLACATPSMAQNPAGLAADPGAAPADPATLALARALVAKTSSGDIISQGWLSFPIAGMLKEMHIGKPEQSKAVMHEVILPTLSQHSAELAEIQAKTYTDILTPEDIKAAITFYSTPAGQHLVAIRPPLLQLNLVAVTQLLETLKPEIQQRAQSTMKAHGWAKG